MKIMQRVFVVSAVLAMAWTQPALAQEGAMKATPVEFFACNFREGKGMADLEKVNKQFNKYADKNDISYSAWMLTAQFTNDPDSNFDVGWLGGWPDSQSFGASQDNWMTKGKDVARAFGEVIDCSGRHELASSVTINAPDSPPGNGVVMFTECTLESGKTGAQAVQASKKFSAEMQSLGAEGSTWLFFPGLGAGDISFDFWRVLGFNNYAELATGMEAYVNKGGWQKFQEIVGAVASCSHPSVFDARLVRDGSKS